MTTTSEYKKNHFVPKTYLKRFTDPLKWNDPVHYINSLNIRDKVIRINNTHTQCQKKNLYKLPDNFSMLEKKAIEKAFMGHIDETYSNAMANSYDRGFEPSNANLNSIMWFVIYQSFRTPKFKYHHLKKVKEQSLKMGRSDSDLEEYSYCLGYLLVKVALDVFKYSVLEILITHINNWFITSDNPASYWLRTWNSTEFVGTILGHHEKTNLKLLCPINPQVAFVLHLNYLKNSTVSNTSKEIQFFSRTIEKEELDYVNRLIFKSCDKQIFSIYRKLLEEFNK